MRKESNLPQLKEINQAKFDFTTLPKDVIFLILIHIDSLKDRLDLSTINRAMRRKYKIVMPNDTRMAFLAPYVARVESGGNCECGYCYYGSLYDVSLAGRVFKKKPPVDLDFKFEMRMHYEHPNKIIVRNAMCSYDDREIVLQGDDLVYNGNVIPRRMFMKFAQNYPLQAPASQKIFIWLMNYLCDWRITKHLIKGFTNLECDKHMLAACCGCIVYTGCAVPLGISFDVVSKVVAGVTGLISLFSCLAVEQIGKCTGCNKSNNDEKKRLISPQPKKTSSYNDLLKIMSSEDTSEKPKFAKNEVTPSGSLTLNNSNNTETLWIPPKIVMNDSLEEAEIAYQMT